MKLRLLPVLAVFSALAITSCTKDKNPDNQTTDPEAIAAASRQELESAVSDRDQLLQLMTEIQQNLSEIKSLENIVSTSSGETPDKREQLKQDIAAIKQALIDKQARLDELESKIASSNLYSANLKNTIETLRTQIEEQKTEIDRLNSELEQAKTRIAQLDNQVDSLNTTVENVSSERDAAQQQSTELANEMNTCFYAVGSGKELKDHKILESGFLRKTKIMKGDFDQDFFIKADKRTLTKIPLHSKKAAVLTNQPKDSYTLDSVNGQIVLTITNPARFWSMSNYLVVKIN